MVKHASWNKLSHLTLLTKRLGINFILPSHIYKQSKTSNRTKGRSKGKGTRSLYIETHDKSIQLDEIIYRVPSDAVQPTNKAIILTKNDDEKEAGDKFLELHKQNIIIKFFGITCQVSTLNSYHHFRRNIYSLSDHAVILSLPTKKT